MSLSSYIMPSPNWLCDMIKNEVTLSTTNKANYCIRCKKLQEICMEFSKDKGLDVVAVVNPGTTMGPVFMLNGSVVVMLDKGLDVVAVVNAGTIMGPVFSIVHNGSVVVMLGPITYAPQHPETLSYCDSYP
uniref:Uncharacterized protein n=1 Tax=Salix viminalis TaxID=40686 RepID=A0A6N2NLU6_SALVM